MFGRRDRERLAAAEARATAAEARLTALIDALPEGVVLLDAEGRYVHWNARYAQIYHRSADLLVRGRRFMEALKTGVARGDYPEAAGREAEWLAERAAKLANPGARHEQQIADGTWLMIEERRTADGGTVGLRVDITALKRQAREIEEAADKRAAVMEALADGLARLAAGDLLCRLQAPFPPEYEALRTDFHRAAESLGAALADIADLTEDMAAKSGAISAAADDLSARTERQAASLQETTAALDEVTRGVREAAAGAESARAVAARAFQASSESGAVMAEAVASMDQVRASAAQVAGVTEVIAGLARQTGLLALNAGIEAGRAGDAGRGFAVIAQEVRSLAQKSAVAAEEIAGLIAASGETVARGADLVTRAGAAFGDIAREVTAINDLVAEMASGARSQAAALQQVNQALAAMDGFTQQNAAMAEETRAATRELALEAGRLGAEVGRFQLPDDRGKAPSVTARTPVGWTHGVRQG